MIEYDYSSDYFFSYGWRVVWVPCDVASLYLVSADALNVESYVVAWYGLLYSYVVSFYGFYFTFHVWWHEDYCVAYF